MTSTELKVGLTVNSRPSSRVLKPPGGGHSNIFAEPEVSVNAPRPKYNQQNSSNLNACMGSTDPNQAVVKLREEIVKEQVEKEEKSSSDNGLDSKRDNTAVPKAASNTNSETTARGRVPPGGYSSGAFW